MDITIYDKARRINVDYRGNVWPTCTTPLHLPSFHSTDTLIVKGVRVDMYRLQQEVRTELTCTDFSKRCEVCLLRTRTTPIKKKQHYG
jgi:hypothetical protein